MCRLEYCGQKNKKYSFEYFLFIRARDGTRTRGPDLGKVVLHQLSHSRIFVRIGVTGFEPATSWSQTRRSSQAEPHPVIHVYI